MPSSKVEMKSVIQEITKEERENSSEGKSPHRVQTQIHRRKKAKAVAPLMNEWERSRTMPPKNLKRSPRDMQKS